MAVPFVRADLERASRELMRDGRWANARVERVTLGGEVWTVKDFAPRAIWVRNSVGRFLCWRELRALDRLAGIAGIPAEAFRLDAHAIAARYLPGTILGEVPAERAETAFLRSYEALLGAVHARGVVHLDTGGGSNMLLLDDGGPGLIDFQAALFTERMPARLRRLLEGIDLAGLYKKWARWQPQSLGPRRREIVERMLRWRRLWVLRGYLGVPRRPRPSRRDVDASP